jgi:hypothetical protein
MPDEQKIDVEVGESSPGTIITKTDQAPTFDDGKELATPSPFEALAAKISSGKSSKDAIGELREETKKKAEKSLKDTLGDPNAEPEKKEEKKVEDKKPEEDEDEEEEASEIAKAEEKEEPKEEKKEDEVKEPEAKSEDEVKDEELKVLPHDKPKTARRIQALLKKVDEVSSKEATTAKQLQEKEARLAELEKQLGEVKSVDPTTNDEIKKQLDELAMYRRRYELDNDPEVKQKFDSRIEGAEKSIKDIFAKKRGGEAINKIIEEEGGWVKFSESGRKITLTGGEEITAAELAEKIREELPLSERRAIDAAEIEQAATAREKQRYFEEQSAKAKEYFTARETESKAAQEKQAQVTKELQDKINTWQNKFLTEQEFFKEEPTDGLTGDKLAEAQDRNKHVKQLKQVLQKNMAVNDLDGTLNVIAESVLYHEERRQHAEAIKKVQLLEAQLKERQAEIDKFKRASSTTPKSGSLSGGGTGKTSSSTTPPDIYAALEAKARERQGI